jgi:hypothetical protein
MDAYADAVGAFPLDEVAVEVGDVTFDELSTPHEGPRGSGPSRCPSPP